MKYMKLVGTASSQQEIFELNMMIHIIGVSQRSRFLGKEARKRMLKGDFSNKPVKKQKKNIKGYV